MNPAVPRCLKVRSVCGRQREIRPGLAGGGKVAHTILYSKRATASKVSLTPTTVPLSAQAKPCVNGAVVLKPGQPKVMREPFDLAATVEFVNSSSRECTAKGIPRYFDELSNGRFLPMVEKYAYFGAGTAPPSTGVPVPLSKDRGGFASFKLVVDTASGPITCHYPGSLAIQAPGQSARFRGAGLRLCLLQLLDVCRAIVGRGPVRGC